MIVIQITQCTEAGKGCRYVSAAWRKSELGGRGSQNFRIRGPTSNFKKVRGPSHANIKP